jgi:hypothetical protein
MSRWRRRSSRYGVGPPRAGSRPDGQGRDLAKTAASLTAADVAHRDAARTFYVALEADTRGTNDETDIADLTPDEEVRLLHIME